MKIFVITLLGLLLSGCASQKFMNQHLSKEDQKSVAEYKATLKKLGDMRRTAPPDPPAFLAFNVVFGFALASELNLLEEEKGLIAANVARQHILSVFANNQAPAYSVSRKSKDFATMGGSLHLLTPERIDGMAARDQAYQNRMAGWRNVRELAEELPEIIDEAQFILRQQCSQKNAILQPYCIAPRISGASDLALINSALTVQRGDSRHWRRQNSEAYPLLLSHLNHLSQWQSEEAKMVEEQIDDLKEMLR